MAGQDESHTLPAPLHGFRKDAAPIERGAVLAGRYQIETLLGRGGAGVVLRAYDRELREAVAIKVLHADLAQEARWVERLAREVKLARQLRHPNVCRVFDFEKADGHVFIVMELAAGGSLRRELEDKTLPARSLTERLGDARAVADGLAAIHAGGVAHRDVTPQNILRMADGRLVVSDFGLATEISQTTTSIHGGTLAYMAPEVVRGQRANLVSDVWALGVVIHEIVFGARPTWNKPVGGAMLTPSPGRTLAGGERLAFDVCRACTADQPSARPQTAGEVAARLRGKRALRGVRRARTLFVGAAVVSLAAAAGLAVRRSASNAPAAENEIRFEGEPRDWTDTTKVLAAVDKRLHCLMLLPDRRTLRFVSGPPNRAEDLDLKTGARTPSPLVPAAYADGCPTLSPDGKHLAFQGHTDDGLAFAFVSDRPDGAGAKALVPIADPSMSSEPKWLPDGRGFTVDVDNQHVGVFSLETKRLTILPSVAATPPLSTLRFVTGPFITVAAATITPPSTTITAFRWPLLTKAANVSIANFALDVATRDGASFLLAIADSSNTAFPLVELSPQANTMRRLGFVRGQWFRFVTAVEGGVVISTLTGMMDVVVDVPDGSSRRITHTGDYAGATACGADVLATRFGPEGSEVVRMDREGGSRRTLLTALDRIDIGCSPAGDVWYFSERIQDRAGIRRCDQAGCQQLTSEAFASITLSPDGQRLALLAAGSGGLTISWMSTSGGPIRSVSNTETGCNPVWSNSHDLWVSRRRAGTIRWIEIDTNTLAETGRAIDGAKDCSDGYPDPKRPIVPAVRIEGQNRSQLRFVPDALLKR